MAGKQVKATFEGFALWALKRYAKLTGKKESTALAALFDRWLEEDSEYLSSRFRITLEEYWRENDIDPEPEHPPDQTAPKRPDKPVKPN